MRFVFALIAVSLLAGCVLPESSDTMTWIEKSRGQHGGHDHDRAPVSHAPSHHY